MSGSQETPRTDGEESAARRSVRLIVALDADVRACKEAPDHETQLGRRQFARTIFAAMEGGIYVFKQLALLEVRELELSLSAGEELFLDEVEYKLNEHGELKSHRAKIRFIQNLKFAFRTFAKIHGLHLTLQTDGDGWCALMESIKVRDRLTHPKQIDDLTVTDREFERLEKAYNWFASTAETYFIEASGALNVKADDTRERVELLEKVLKKMNEEAGTEQADD